jgi:hypothetical protein
MEEMIAEFDWESQRTPDEKCRVYLRERSGLQKIHIEAYTGGVLKSKGVTFRREELPNIIKALQEAQKRLESK